MKLQLFILLSALIFSMNTSGQNTDALKFSPTKFVIDTVSFDSILTEVHKQINKDSVFFNDFNRNLCCSENPPKFPGGEKALYKFLSDNLIYPDTPIKERIEGKILISFSVDTLGKIYNTKILKGISTRINNETLRVVALMPDWIPASCEDKKKICLNMFLPIEFKL